MEFQKKLRIAIKRILRMVMEKTRQIFYDLAMSIGKCAIPIGGDYRLEEHAARGLRYDPLETLFKTFFGDVKLALAQHYPDLNGDNFKERVVFICDENPDVRWTETFRRVHCMEKQTENRFGGLSFEDDENPKHVGLQVADFLAALYRQQSYRRTQSEILKPRIIDLIIFRNLGPPNGGAFNISFMHEPIFKTFVEAMRKVEQAHKRKCELQGVQQKYYPLDHIDSIRTMVLKMAPSKRAEFIKWMKKTAL